MDYFRGFRVLRNDPDWTNKILVGSVLMMSAMVVPIVGQVVLTGWQALIIRRALRGDETLPRLDFDFDYLGKLFGTGFKGFIARFVWAMPITIIAVILFACSYAAFGVLVAQRGSDAPWLGCCLASTYLIIVPLIMVAQLPAAVAGLRAELADDLNAGLKFREVLDFTKGMWRELVKGGLLLGLVSIPLSMVGMLVCCVGIFVVQVFLTVAWGHFLAQVYAEWVARGGEAVPLAEDTF